MHAHIYYVLTLVPAAGGGFSTTYNDLSLLFCCRTAIGSLVLKLIQIILLLSYRTL